MVPVLDDHHLLVVKVGASHEGVVDGMNNERLKQRQQKRQESSTQTKVYPEKTVSVFNRGVTVVPVGAVLSQGERVGEVTASGNWALHLFVNFWLND